MHLSMLSPTPQVRAGWGFDLTSNQFPHPGAEIGDQIPHLSPHSEVRKIGDLTYMELSSNQMLHPGAEILNQIPWGEAYN